MTIQLESKEAVEAGKVYDILKGISTAFTDVFKFLNECSIKAKDAEPVTDAEGKTVGELFTAVTKQGNQIKIKLVQSSGRKDLYDMYCLAKNGKKEAYPHIKIDKIDDKLTEFAKDAYDEELVDFDNEDFNVEDEFADMDFSSASKIQIELSKIKGSKEIKFGKVYCNYDPSLAFDDLDEVLDCDEVQELICEEPQCLEIIPTENAYVINQLDSIACCNNVSEILKAQCIAIILLENLIKHCDSTCCNVQSFIQSICWQKEWLLHSSLWYNCSSTLIDVLQSIDLNALAESSLTSDEILANYADTLDLYYGSFDHEIQKLIDDWLLTIRYNGMY